ncbi:MAG: electron transfer flavoprotein subunit alpha/FixB family protein [Flavobacteriaceae bacterium]
MSVLVYTETLNGKFKKNAFEAASYAFDLAQKIGQPLVAIAFNAENCDALFNYGVSKVLHIKQENLATFNAKVYAKVISEIALSQSTSTLILSATTDAKYMGGILAAKLKAGFAPNVVAAPLSIEPLVVKRMTFSNKGFAHTRINTDFRIIGVSNNSFGLVENNVEGTVEEISADISDSDFNTRSVNVERVTGKVTIADADIVVSGGRGLKGPENWGMVEELAEVLGAATACSKPVSDMGWRSHSEHVGQTGKPVACNLYIAIGISGAIQHLAGINASKVKVVINTDPEAPFFKAADYGIVGDAFEVVPELIEKLKEFKAQNA